MGLSDFHAKNNYNLLELLRIHHVQTKPWGYRELPMQPMGISSHLSLGYVYPCGVVGLWHCPPPPPCGVVGVWYGMLGRYGVYGRSGMACLESMVCLMFGMYGRYGMYGMSGWYCMDGRYGM